jgi:Protein of unknown function (DUF2798)
MKKLPKKFTPLVVAFFMSFFMSAFMSGVITLINTGFNDGYFLRWGQAWILALPAAFFVAYAARPLVMKMVALTVE